MTTRNRLAALLDLRKNHLVMSGFYKGLSGLSLFVSIPLLFDYLGDADYGLWVLVFALFQWVLLMDFGLASVLKTKVPVLLYEGKTELLKSYLRGTYALTALIALVLFLVSVAAVFGLDLKAFFNVRGHSLDFIRTLFLLNMFFFCANFVLNVQKSLFVAFLKGKYAEQSIAANQILFLGGAVLLPVVAGDAGPEEKLLIVSLLNGLSGIMTNLGYTVYFFLSEKIGLRSRERTPRDFLREIIVLGAKYMLIQLGLLFIYASDNFILSNVFGPKKIPPYEVVSKYFQLPLMVLYAALSPLWSVFARHYVEKDVAALRVLFRRFNTWFFGIALATVLLALVFHLVLPYWIKGGMAVPAGLVALMCGMTIIRIFTTFYTFFLNGIGRLRTYIWLILATAALKLPLSYLLIEHGYGLGSVVLATCVLTAAWAIVVPWECYAIVRKLAGKAAGAPTTAP